jgi:hypothetical protein
MPKLHDGDTVSSPHGNLWLRRHSIWIAPGQPNALNVTDASVATSWNTRHRTDSQFTLIQQLQAQSLYRLDADAYVDDFSNQWLTGKQLRQATDRLLHDSLITVHLELPSGIVTLHSRRAPTADTVYLPI